MTFIQRTARILRQIAIDYNETKGDKDCEKHFRVMLSKTIRNSTDHPSFHIRASKAALEKARELGIPIEKMTYDNQPRWDKGRKIFCYEHVVPVNKMMRLIMANPDDAQVVLEMACIAWVLRSENDRLDEAGYKKDRDDPFRVYADLGIELV